MMIFLLAFSSATRTVVPGLGLDNIDASCYRTQSVQYLYSLAIMLDVPLHLLSALRIMENEIFVNMRSGKIDERVKWEENRFSL